LRPTAHRAAAAAVLSTRAAARASALDRLAHRRDVPGTVVTEWRPEDTILKRTVVSPVRRAGDVAAAAEVEARNAAEARELQRGLALGASTLGRAHRALDASAQEGAQDPRVAAGAEADAPVVAAVVPRPSLGRSSQGASEFARANTAGLAAPRIDLLISSVDAASGFTPLHVACAAGQADVAEKLLACGADCDVEAVPVPRRVPTAAEAAELLAKAQADEAHAEKRRRVEQRKAERAARKKQRLGLGAEEEEVADGDAMGDPRGRSDVQVLVRRIGTAGRHRAVFRTRCIRRGSRHAV